MSNEEATQTKPRSGKPHLSLKKYLTAIGQAFMLRSCSLIWASWDYFWQPIWQGYKLTNIPAYAIHKLHYFMQQYR